MGTKSCFFPIQGRVFFGNEFKNRWLLVVIYSSRTTHPWKNQLHYLEETGASAERNTVFHLEQHQNKTMIRKVQPKWSRNGEQKTVVKFWKEPYAIQTETLSRFCEGIKWWCKSKEAFQPQRSGDHCRWGVVQNPSGDIHKGCWQFYELTAVITYKGYE